MVTEAVKSALIMLLLEPFLVPGPTWFEQHVDFLSVAATLVHDVAATRWQRLVVAVKHYAAHRD